VEAIKCIQSRTVVFPNRDIDTDQIIPARFLTTTSREGLGAFLFHDLRFNKNGEANENFVLNQAESKGCEILVGGNNFGCGSSREHAPWALLDYGIRVVISTEIADIFRSNSLKNGLIPVIVDSQTLNFLLQNPGIEVTVDVVQSALTLPDGRTFDFSIDGFARYCLVEGIDQLGFLRNQMAAIEKFEDERPWMP
jgi:3-isopropylmalate/(R)-2-methylmalate dehydratase small subunit